MSQVNSQVEKYIQIALERQKAHLYWESLGAPLTNSFLESISDVDKEFWTAIDKMEGVDINIVRNAEIEAGILESYRAYS